MPGSRISPGNIIDGFEIGEHLHRGGMASLWQVRKPGYDFPLVLKSPILTEGEEPAAIVGFEMEQMILPRLSGPHVPKFVSSGDFSAEPYLVMERLPGKSLYHRLEDLPLPVSEVAGLGVKIATAIASLHRQNVVHLDIKPSNIMFRSSGEAVLIDYGLSRQEELPDLLQEEFRLPYGTAPYMAPEQIMGVRVEPRSDIFALGVLLYFFATGVRPFGDPKTLKGLKRRIWRDPMPPRALNADIPLWFQEIVLRCLEVVPERRYPTAAQLAFDLTNPQAVKLTPRAEKLKPDSWSLVLKRRLNPDDVLPRAKMTVKAQMAQSPIIAAAISLAEENEALGTALRGEIARIRQSLPGARVACIHVMRLNRIAMDKLVDEEGQNLHLQRLIELRHWAKPMGLEDEEITFHVLEAVDPAAAILDYARANEVDHIVMGARANSTLRNLLGSVSGEVAAKAPCSVTVVRARGEQVQGEGKTGAK